jgi:hypothetical protein
LSRFDLIGLDSMLPSSGRCFAPTGPSDLVFAVVTILLPESHRRLHHLCHLCRLTHPPHRTTIPAEGGRERGALSARGRAWGGGERIGSGAIAPDDDAGFAKEVLDWSSGKLDRNGSWKGGAQERTRLGPQGSWHRPEEAAEKVKFIYLFIYSVWID